MKILSLFSGAGGLDIGFHDAGFDIVGCIEIEKLFCQTLAENALINKYLSSNCRVFNQDITTFNVDKLDLPQIDFVIGGPPCQTYSASGRRIGGASGLEDPRGQLFEHYCRILEQLNPQGFLFENVRGLLGVNNGEAWKAIVKAFSDSGYKLSYCLLDAAAYGVPQHRERIFLVGTRSNQTFLFPRPLFGPDSTGKRPYLTAGEVLSDLQDPNEAYHEYNGKYGYLLAGIPEGMNYSYYTAEMGHPEPVFAWRSKFSSFLYKIAQDRPVKTIQAQLGKFAGPFHWKNRRLTIAELKRLQSFPDDYEFCGSYDQINRQIGNSVPPLLAKILANAVTKQLFDTSAYLDLELMPENFKQTFDARKGESAAKTRLITKHSKTNEAILETAEYQRQTEKLIFSYASPVKKTVLSFEHTLKMLEAGQQYSNADSAFQVEILRVEKAADILQLKIRRLKPMVPSQPSWYVKLELFNPLKDGTKQLEAMLYSDNEQDIYVAWDALEETIKQRSAYISLVAIHGHFAEPKIKFAVTVENLADFNSPLARLIQFFSRFENCGRNLPADFISHNTDVVKEELPTVLRQLRNVRYDIRSHHTSTRIPKDVYFCAYPFPELNAAYQVRKPV